MTSRALVVEDEPDTGELLAELLRRRGYDPTVLSEGRPAVAWARQHRPDLVLLDLMLPDMDGFSVCESLKLERDTNLVPVIMVTALGGHEDRVRGLQVGANQYLTKPFTPDQLNAAIDRVVAWREELRQHGAAGEIHFRLQSDLGYLDELNHLLSALFLYSGLSEDRSKQLATAVREIGTNAIEWGHRKRPEQIITVTYRIDAEKITIVVRDSGPGFDPENLPHAARAEDPVGHMMVREALGLREGGFGILLARGLVDELRYNETGNEARLVKYFPPTHARPDSPNGH